MDLIEIGGRIKAHRKSMGISQEKLAEMIFVSPHYIYEIERGMKAMSL
ncbi:MAG: helix-turn-helix transcriptional regulator [Oscillospiraceae bacterium]|nr:helix-turn-helix transcriptional regulator [Oscillospiraceae bacterium]